MTESPSTQSTPQPEPAPIPPEIPLTAILEAVLFVAANPAAPTQLAQAAGRTQAEVEAGLEALEAELQSPGRGLRLQRFRGRVSLITAPALAPAVERFLGVETPSHLSRAALEALAIVLYRGPVTRPQIDAVRGVNSDGVLKSLLHKGLIQEIGRAELPGRPILYSPTTDCLQYFGLTSLSELPPLNLEET